MARLQVFGGQVNCPARGTINLEICYGCRRFTRLRERRGVPVVCCAISATGQERPGKFMVGRPGSF